MEDRGMSYHGSPSGYQQDTPAWLQISGEPAHPIYAAPQQPQPPRKRSFNWVPSLILVLVGMLLALSAMFMAWFTVYEDVNATDLNVQVDFGLSSVSMKDTTMGRTMSMTFGYDYFRNSFGMGNVTVTAQINAFLNTFSTTQLILLIGIAMAVIALILVLLAVLNKMPSYIGGIIGVLGSIFVVLAPLYLMITLPSVTFPMSVGVQPQGGFWGSTSQSYMGTSILMTWGAGTGWWLSIVAFVLLLIGSAMAFSIKRPAQMAPAVVPPQPMPYPYAQAQPQP